MPQAVRDHQIQEVGDDEVDYELPTANSLVGSHANLIPIPGNVQSTRVFYGARFYNQSLPVVGGEAPLVQSLIDNDIDGRSFDDHYGERAGAIRADDDYEVLEVLKDRLRLKNARNEIVEKDLYDELPFNRKSMITHRPLVKAGDKVTKGKTLAASNYTDDNGTLAMGLNARIGITPYKGYSMDDAVVIRQGFADRLRSQTTETFKQDRDADNIVGRNHFQSLFPDKFTKDQLSLVDDDGVVTPGTIVQPGDPLILTTRPRVLSSTSGELGKLSKTMRQVRSDASQVWEGDSEARVMKVAKTKNGVKVVVVQERGTKDGDKITLRHGQKGTVSLILPDDHMPRTTDGEPLDMLLNPQGMPSRANFSTLYEVLLGKIARKKGAPIKLPMFLPPGVEMYDYVEQQLKEAGLSDVEEIYDPKDNRKLENPITVGMGFIQKLHHTSASKADARGQGSYDLNEQPAKGGAGGAKRLSGLETHALMSSGAYATLREGATIRGQKNDDYWRMLRAGHTPRDPDEPFVWKKFRGLMSGAGLRMRDEAGGKNRLGPLTDDDVDAYNPLEVRNGRTLDMRTLEPENGGLFDRALVGNNKWGKITLPEPMLNPAFEGPARHLLGLKLKDLQAVMAGEMDLPEDMQRRIAERVRVMSKSAGESCGLDAVLQRIKAGSVQPAVYDPNFEKEPTPAFAVPKTGPDAIHLALASLDLDELEKEQHKMVASGKVSKRNGAVQTLNAISGLKANNVRPEQLMITKVPVVPPAFRPSALVGETFIPGDANELYKDLFDLKDVLAEAKSTFGDDGAVAERKAFQSAVKAVYGYGDPVNPKSLQRGVSGFLRQISGTNPKLSFFQRKLISKTQDQVGRGVITPDPELTLDEIGLPEDMAWEMYGTYIMRRLVRNGMHRSEALRQIKDRSKFARQALEAELPDRPIVYSRSPAWHQYNIISGTPKLITGDTIRISPFVAAGLGADYDGDTINLHVPASPDAVREAREILRPSSMLFSIKDDDKVMPRLVQEQILGPYAASQRPSKAVHSFPDRESALKAIRAGTISLSDEIEIPDIPVKAKVAQVLDTMRNRC